MRSSVGEEWEVTDITMMEDGRLVLCLPAKNILLICNAEGRKEDILDIRDKPWCVTPVNSSTVAILLYSTRCIEVYNIINKQKSISVHVPELLLNNSITTIINNIVVCGTRNLMIIDHQTGEVVQTIQTDFDSDRLHGSGERIFYCDYSNRNYNLYSYSYTDNIHHILALESTPKSMTTLQDGSLYVLCEDGSVKHISSDGKQYETVETMGLQKSKEFWIFYNSKQRKLFKTDNLTGLFNVFCEI
ncbi:unnamed protein product [Mytilus coruscus]|uniref:Uncharacterized protein n=1 Tax=Mytilus coruscus TaxID=42192 RepID=A0A6J8D4B2_MYTCO|nr:unnamed protein product [Mytilus coruscus]